MKGYKWEQRAECPEMPPLDIKKLNNDACMYLIQKNASEFIKDYKSAVKYGDAKRRGATIAKCRSDLDHPYYEALMAYIGTSKDEIMKEVGDNEGIEAMRSL